MCGWSHDQFLSDLFYPLCAHIPSFSMLSCQQLYLHPSEGRGLLGHTGVSLLVHIAGSVQEFHMFPTPRQQETHRAYQWLVGGQTPSSFVSMQGTLRSDLHSRAPCWCWPEIIPCLDSFFPSLNSLTDLLSSPGSTFLIKHLLLNPWFRVCFWETQSAQIVRCS